MLQFAVAFAVGLIGSLGLTWIVRQCARKYGFVDHPDGGRKSHQAPVALGGGAAVFGAMILAWPRAW